MIQRAAETLSGLFELDETAWLEAMAELIRQGHLDDLDYTHLREYLEEMARRDRREVESRLAVLIAHLLKWTYQAERRSGSWRGTIVAQRQELARLLDRGVLRNHAAAVLAEVYADAVERTSAETELPPDTFPAECPYTLDQLLSADALRHLIGVELMHESKFVQEIQNEAAAQARLEQVRINVQQALDVRFGAGASAEFRETLSAIHDLDQLSELHRLAIKSRGLAAFRRALARLAAENGVRS
jgi:hypothetical protein